MAQVTGKRNKPELSARDRDASDPLMPRCDDAEARDSDRRKREKMDCSGDRDSVSSLPSTLAAYIREEHQHSGGTDRCLTLNAPEVTDIHS